MTLAVKDETTKLKLSLTGKAAFDSLALEDVFEKCRLDEAKMAQLVDTFCETYLLDGKQRTLKLRPMQKEIIVKALTHRENGAQRKLAVLAPRGSGKSYALAVACTIYMFFKRFRDLIFILAPSEDQAALIFNYVYRNFKDNAFLDSLIDNYKFHNKPHIRMKGGTLMRRAPLAPSNQGQAIRGQHPTFCIVDESPLISDNLFIDNVEPAIVSNKAPFINLGTPKSKDNHMYRYLYDDAYEATWTRLTYTWRDAVKKGEAYSPPYSEEEMLEKMLEWGEDSIYWRTEYECEFVESVSNIFNPEKIKACFHDCSIYTPEDIPLQNNEPKISGISLSVDIGKSVNSTVLTAWATVRGETNTVAQLVYMEEINPRTGGHDIPYQRQRIMDVATEFNVDRLIVDCTGIGGAIEQDLRVACIQASPQIHFVPFIFTGGPRGSKTQIYRDYVSFVQQQRVVVPDPAKLLPHKKRLVLKWFREHVDLEYTMDAANKTEKISAPTGKHDDYCDSSAMGVHAALSMLPGSATIGAARIGSEAPRSHSSNLGGYSNSTLFTTKARKPGINKGFRL